MSSGNYAKTSFGLKHSSTLRQGVGRRGVQCAPCNLMGLTPDTTGLACRIVVIGVTLAQRGMDAPRESSRLMNRPRRQLALLS